MDEKEIREDGWLGPVRRNPAIFSAVLVLTLAMGAGWAWATGQTNQATLDLRYEAYASPRYPNTPTMDELISFTGREEAREAVAGKSGMTLEELKSGVKVYRSTVLLNHLTVSVKGSDADALKAAAIAFQEQLKGYIAKEIITTRLYYERSGKEAAKRLAVIRSYTGKGGSVSQPKSMQDIASLSSTVNALESQIYDSKQRLVELNRLLLPVGEPVVEKARSGIAILISAVVAGVLGLIFAYVAVAILGRRRTA